jgi:hypothetical protein
MELPKNESTFNIEMVGDTTFKKYEGQFTVRCVLTAGQRHAMELEKSRLLGNFTSPTDALIGLAEVLATLRARVIESPEWWRQSAGGSMLSDENVLMELYNKVSEVETQWRQKVKDLANPPPPKDLSSPNT